MEELTRPREMKTHEPGQPLELPAPLGASASDTPPARGPAPAAPAAPQEQPNTPPLNVMPQPRGFEKIER